jgi:hypothetical protein
MSRNRQAPRPHPTHAPPLMLRARYPGNHSDLLTAAVLAGPTKKDAGAHDCDAHSDMHGAWLGGAAKFATHTYGHAVSVAIALFASCARCPRRGWVIGAGAAVALPSPRLTSARGVALHVPAQVCKERGGGGAKAVGMGGKRCGLEQPCIAASNARAAASCLAAHNVGS